MTLAWRRWRTARTIARIATLVRRADSILSTP